MGRPLLTPAYSISTLLSPAWAAVRSRRERPAISMRRIAPSCWNRWDSTPASISKRLGSCASGLKPGCRAKPFLAWSRALACRRRSYERLSPRHDDSNKLKFRTPMIKIPTQQIPGFYHRRIGDIVVTAISDGYLDAPMTVAHGLPTQEAEKILTDACRPRIPRISVNCFAVYSGGRLALIE